MDILDVRAALRSKRNSSYDELFDNFGRRRWGEKPSVIKRGDVKSFKHGDNEQF